MRQISYKLLNYFYKSSEHPYRKYVFLIQASLGSVNTILDIGCGRDAEVLNIFSKGEKKLYGIDIGKLNKRDKLHLVQNNASFISFKSASFDLVISRSAVEHFKKPISIFNEINRVLTKNGNLIFLTPNLYDYASIVSKIIPNKFHQKIVKMTEGRDEDDTFPTYYRANTYNSIKKIANESGFKIIDFEYLGQYPSYFLFNPIFFLFGTIYDKYILNLKMLKFLRAWCLVVLEKEN